MKTLILALSLITTFLSLVATDYLTIYNQNQALYKTSLELNLKKGVQYYSLENIPTGIITESVIFVPKEKQLLLFSQNFEYDLANSQKMIEKYINRSVNLFTEKEQYSGTLVFYDFNNFGLLNNKTNELNVISANRIVNVQLSEMPQDFYSKPTLRWQLSAQRDGKYQAGLSYLTTGIDWRATYNAVLHKDELILNSWVTINNRSGKDFKDVKLKLIAGNVETHQQRFLGRGKANMIAYAEDTMLSAPVFEERAFSDYRIYTLDKPADINNNQEKQLSLYPLKNVKFLKKYEYRVQSREVAVIISFKNSEKDGLGLPLPKGNINFYEIDDKDNTEQFVGVNSIEHTSLNQDVNLKIGTAFDIVADTKITDSQQQGKVRTNVFEITLTNNKKENVTVDVITNISAPNGEILNSSLPYKKLDAFTYLFEVTIDGGKSEILSYTERVSR